MIDKPDNICRLNGCQNPKIAGEDYCLSCLIQLGATPKDCGDLIEIEINDEYQKIKKKIGPEAAKNLADMSKIYEGTHAERIEIDTRLRKLR